MRQLPPTAMYSVPCAYFIEHRLPQGEQKFHGLNLKFPRTFVPESESSCKQEVQAAKGQGVKVLGIERARKRIGQLGHESDVQRLVL